MSKTDKTAPTRVRLMNKPSYLQEWHNHTDGVCDLPAQRALSPRTPTLRGHRTQCEWVQSNDFWNDKENWCGCPHCADQVERKAKARRNRYAGRRYAQSQWVREYE